MSTQRQDTPDHTHPVQRSQKLDNVCDDFERAWLAGRGPKIEDYLAEAHAGVRGELFEELVISELRLQVANGIAPDRDQYVRRFPDCEHLIDRIIGQAIEKGTSPRRSGKTSGSAGPGSGGSLSVRCPHCHNPIEVVVDARLDDITCSACGSHFSLVQDELTTRDASKITTVGHFELIERLGLGGFGTVWKARDTQLDRTVAVKIPRHGQLGPSDTEKFLREARAIAQLSHPNIVRVYEVGRDGDTVYIVSDLIRGVSLADRLTAGPLTPREAAKLCARIADALQHAHDAGVVHRDLKPQNIMLARIGPIQPVDGPPSQSSPVESRHYDPVIMDFGLARREAGEVTMTIEGQLLGTPAYMSPEQARGEAHRADRRTDIYSLGVILFELLTGELPFRGNARMLIHQVTNEDAPSPRKLNSAIPRDLETICLKCLEKEPSRRYQVSREVADELNRYCHGEPIRARPISAASRVWRWGYRNAVVASLASLLATTLVIFAIAGPLVALRQTRLAQQREQEIHVSTVTRLAAESHGIRGEVPIRSVLLAVEAAELDRRKTSKVSPVAHEAVLNATVSLGGTPLAEPGNESKWLAASPDGKWVATRDQTNSVLLWDFGVEDPMDSPTRLDVTVSDSATANFSADGKQFYLRSTSGSLAEWSLNKPLASEPTQVYPDLGTFVSFAVSADSRWLVLAREDWSLVLVDLLSADPIASSNLLRGSDDLASSVRVKDDAYVADQFGGVRDSNRSVWISDDNRWIIAFHALAGRKVDIWRIGGEETNGTPLVIELDEVVLSVLLHRRDNRLFVGTEYGNIYRFDLNSDDPTQQPTLHLKGDRSEDPVIQMACSNDGRRLFTVSNDLKIWDLEDEDPNRTYRVLHGHDGFPRSIAVSSDERWLISGGVDGTTRVWDLGTDDPNHHCRVLRGHELRVAQTWASADGRWVVSASPIGEPRVWDCRDQDPALSSYILQVASPGEAKNRSHLKRVREMSLSRDGRWLATGAEDTTVRLWDLAAPNPATAGRALMSHQRPVYAVSMTPDGQWLLTAGDDPEARLWDLRHQQINQVPILLPGHTDMIRTACISPDARWVCTGCYDGTVRRWELGALLNGERTAPIQFRGHRGKLMTSAFSPDSRWLATACDAGDVFVWDLASQPPAAAPRPLGGHVGAIFSITFSADDQYLVTSGDDATVKLWDVRGEKPALCQVFDFAGGIFRVAISPNNRWLGVHELWTDYVELFDLYVANPQSTGRKLPAKYGAQSMAISPDSHWLAIGTSRDLAMLWDLRENDVVASRRLLRGHRGSLWSTVFSPASDWLYTSDDNGKVIRWPLELDDLLRRAKRAAGRELTAEERFQYGLFEHSHRTSR